jgi:hypothetical protein
VSVALKFVFFCVLGWLNATCIETIQRIKRYRKVLALKPVTRFAMVVAAANCCDGRLLSTHPLPIFVDFVLLFQMTQAAGGIVVHC